MHNVFFAYQKERGHLSINFQIVFCFEVRAPTEDTDQYGRRICIRERVSY